MASKRSAIVFFLFLLLLYSIHWTHNHDAKISYPLLTIHFKWKTEQKSWYKYSGVAAIPMFKNTFCIIYNTAKQWELCCNSMFSGFLSLSCVSVRVHCVYIICKKCNIKWWMKQTHNMSLFYGNCQSKAYKMSQDDQQAITREEEGYKRHVFKKIF